MLALLFAFLLVVLVVVIALVVIKWLLILAVIIGLIWLIGFFMRSAEARWYRW
jgi:hypothetical protein